MIEAIKAIWNGFKWILEMLKAVLQVGWAVLTGLIAIIGTIWAALIEGIYNVVSFMGRLWDALAGGRAALDSFILSGVPAPLVNVVGYAANYVPIHFILSSCVYMATLFVGVAAVRVIKSWLPTVS